MKQQSVVVVDAFTDRPFGGNPAAICVRQDAAPEGWMQQVATEMNLAETAFLYPEGDGWRLRWFTPASEVPLCGHATLASAHLLWEDGILAITQPAQFYTQSGLLIAEKIGELIQLNFPQRSVEAITVEQAVISAVGVTSQPVFTGLSAGNIFLEIESAEELRQLLPDFSTLKNLNLEHGIIVTAAGDTDEYDFQSRFFAPGLGVDEDPVTGSAHTTLIPYWSAKLGKTVMKAYQASARGGKLEVELIEDRVLMRGTAVTVMRGELLV